MGMLAAPSTVMSRERNKPTNASMLSDSVEGGPINQNKEGYEMKLDKLLLS